MASLIQKTKTLLQANMHAILDKAMEQNSPAIIKQYIRDVEKNLDELEDAAASIGGTVKTLERQYKQYKAKADKLDRNIDMLLTQGKEQLAVAAQEEMNSTRRLQEQYHEQWVRQQREYEALNNARLKLQAKLKTMRQEQKEMEALLRLAKSKETTVKAIKSIDDLQGVGDSDIARMRDSVYARLDKASAHSEMYATRLDSQMDDVLGKAELDMQLEERKRRLGLASAPEPTIEELKEEEKGTAEDSNASEEEISWADL